MKINLKGVSRKPPQGPRTVLYKNWVTFHSIYFFNKVTKQRIFIYGSNFTKTFLLPHKNMNYGWKCILLTNKNTKTFFNPWEFSVKGVWYIKRKYLFSFIVFRITLNFIYISGFCQSPEVMFSKIIFHWKENKRQVMGRKTVGFYLLIFVHI